MLSDYKIRRTLHTIEYLLQHGAAVKLITHQEPVNNKPLSTKPLMAWFTQQGYPVFFSPILSSPVPAKSIMLCENIRFFDGEKSHDASLRAALARDLQHNTDYYIFDGWGVAHRSDTSVADIALLFAPEKRSIGSLVQDEIKHLYPLIAAPKHPFIALCAGNKEEKLISIEKIHHLDTILLGPELSFSTHASTKITIPSDYLANNSSIGTQTTQEWVTLLQKAKTVLCNGLMGFLETPETLAPFNQLLGTIAARNVYSVIAGGSTTSYVDYKKLTNKFSFCSTGGGSTLAYLAQQALPGLEPFV